MENKFYIERTLRLAKKAAGFTSPNPMVGALLIKNNQIIAEDYHKKPGTPHAEALVLSRAGEKSKGSTLYVNLEPCCHTDKRTPPCTKAIINAGIKKVVIAMLDPNPKVAGKGVEELSDAGIEVIHGILEDKAKKLNEAYIKYITTKKPFFTLKIAMTLDGKIATPEGQSKWITGEKSRKLVHRIRSSSDAVMTAIGTVKADDPRLTARIKRGKNPIRIVIDPELQIPLNSQILKTPPETIIVTKNNNPHIAEFERLNIELINFNDKLDLNWLASELGKREITSVLLEGGSSFNSYVLEHGIVDKVMFFIAPKIIGGKDSFPAVGGKLFKRLEDAYNITDIKVKKIGSDILVEGYLKKS